MIVGATCFAGIGAPEAAMPGICWLWHAEVDRQPASVLARHHPASVNLGDVQADDFMQRASALGRLDLIVGGPPCQDYSIAGRREGIEGARGNLSLRWAEIVHGIGSRIAVTENVPGWLSMPDNSFGQFLGALVGHGAAIPRPFGGSWPHTGMVAGPWARAAWRVLDAQHFGLAQRRERVFIVSSADPGIDPAQILFEPKGVRRHPAPRRKARKGVARPIGAGAAGGSGDADDADTADSLIPEIVGQAISCKWSKGSSGPDGDEHHNLVPELTHALRGEGFDASEDGTGRGVPIIPFDTTEITSPHNRSQSKIGAPCHPLAAGAHAPPIAFPAEMSGTQVAAAEDRSPALSVKHTMAVATQWAVRRLMPMECERLQGFPDGWTERGADKPLADGPRYKALGNSMAVPVMRWILERCLTALERGEQA